MSEFLKKNWFAVAFIALNGFGLFTVGVFHLGTWYNEVNREIDQIPPLVEEVNELPVTFERIDAQISQIPALAEKVNEIPVIVERLDNVEARLDRIEDKLDRVIDRLNTLPSTYNNATAPAIAPVSQASIGE